MLAYTSKIELCYCILFSHEGGAEERWLLLVLTTKMCVRMFLTYSENA